MFGRQRAIIGGVLAVGLLISAPTVAQVTTSSAQCRSLQNEDFSHFDEGPTRITSVDQVERNGNIPGFCKVAGYIWPQISFVMLIPTNDWNGKFYESGCGGACGYLPSGPPEVWCPLQRGYACIATDTGHEGRDGLWAYNNPQAQIDFGSRGIHVVAIVGKMITERFYGHPPRYAYFEGCSLGSQQALIEAQRFPGDFNGLIGSGVWIGDIESSMDFIWGARALRGEDGKPIVTHEELKYVHQAVLAKCDLDDGVKDGLIGNPAACKFDPAELLCTGAKQANCLTAKQVDALRKVYSGPTTSAGVKLGLGGSYPGSEQDWVVDANGNNLGVGEWITSDGREGAGLPELWVNIQFHGLVVPPLPEWKISDFDFDRDYKRYSNGAKESFLHESNPDLRKLKAAGSKLILDLGWKEWGDPRRAIDYYENVERVIGNRKDTQDFLRLFIIPGANHCSTGEGPWSVDWLTYMENWVERGEAPDKVIGAHVAGKRAEIGWGPLTYPLDSSVHVDFTRPIYPYPLWAKYKGSGDPNRAENFKPVESARVTASP